MIRFLETGSRMVVAKSWTEGGTGSCCLKGGVSDEKALGGGGVLTVTQRSVLDDAAFTLKMVGGGKFYVVYVSPCAS